MRATSDLMTAYDIAMGEYTFQANGRFPSTQAMVRALRRADDLLRFQALSLSSAQLAALEKAALPPRPVYFTTGLAPAPPRVGVQVFNHSRSGTRALSAKMQGTSIILTRRESSTFPVTWWILSNRDERLPGATNGTFRGSSSPGATWTRW